MTAAAGLDRRSWPLGADAESSANARKRGEYCQSRSAACRSRESGHVAVFVRKDGEPQRIARHRLRVRVTLVRHPAEGPKERLAAQRWRQPHRDERFFAGSVTPRVCCSRLNRPHISGAEEFLPVFGPQANQSALDLKSLFLARMKVWRGDDRTLTEMKIELAVRAAGRCRRVPPHEPLAGDGVDHLFTHLCHHCPRSRFRARRSLAPVRPPSAMLGQSHRVRNDHTHLGSASTGAAMCR
jgi:hypothetical protein